MAANKDGNLREFLEVVMNYKMKVGGTTSLHLRKFVIESWIRRTKEKESLITELRKELRLSNEEHRELLARVNDDDVIRRIREWRQSGGHQPGMLGAGQSVHDPIPSPSVSAATEETEDSQVLTFSILCWSIPLLFIHLQ
ncbi:hypothetical protein HAX54_049480 [Datura stramonium]|uniref:ENT domain-containing protein n=1 Tax=Datura stramonium TaxID=4076 RepID=A0ABS8RQM9_DATST|nr:hypothetical protein [Datura stramonium]